jgi:hypothetical protein
MGWFCLILFVFFMMICAFAGPAVAAILTVVLLLMAVPRRC